MELALTNLGEVTAKELHRKNDSYGMASLESDVKNAGEAVNDARKSVEKKIGRNVVTKENHINLKNQENLKHLE